MIEGRAPIDYPDRPERPRGGKRARGLPRHGHRL